MATDPRYVLLVEDDADILEALELLFTGEGIAWERVTEAPIDRERPPSVALLDLSLDHATTSIAATLTALRVPIIVASASPAAVEAARALGAIACLQKPYDFMELISIVRRVAPGIGRPRR